MRATLTIIVVALVSLFLLPALAIAQSTAQPSTQPVQTGAFQVHFNEKDPLSSPDRLAEALRQPVSKVEEYDVNNESWEMYVPPNYDPAKQWGIMVWVNAAPMGRVPSNWAPLLEKYQLIGIGANNSGNNRTGAVRFALALDAVHNLRKLYNIDETRVYTAGISGGGKIATILAVVYPDVFDGAIGIVGVSYYGAVMLPDNERRYWPPEYARPPITLLNRARERVRIVGITGPNDMNYQPIYGKLDRGLIKDHFKYVKLIDVPGMGHQMPDPKYVAEAIEFMDQPLPDLAATEANYGPNHASKSKRAVATSSEDDASDPAPAALAGIDDGDQTVTSEPSASASAAPAPAAAEASAQEDKGDPRADLSMAKNYIQVRMFDKARERLNRIVKYHANSLEADEAQSLLKQIKDKH